MKRMIIITMLLMLCTSCAMAESWEIDRGGNMLCLAETLLDALPEDLAQGLAATPFAGDRVISGATLAYTSKRSGEEMAKVALIAVEHEGAPLLLGGQLNGEAWRILPESETLLRENEPFSITVVKGYGQGSAMNDTIRTVDVLLAIDYGEDMFLLRPTYGYQMYSMIADVQWFNLYGYVRMDENGNGLTITCQHEGKPWVVHSYASGQAAEIGSCRVRWPIGAAYIDGDAFPRDLNELQTWAAEHPVDESSAWVLGANMRERATADSASLGMYSIAPLTVLERKSGKIDYWYKSRVGDTVGWISGTYVTCGDETDDDEGQLRSQIMPALIAVNPAETSLMADGQVVQTLPAGTAMQIFAFTEDTYHVQIPQGEVSWQLDVPALYGYVSQDAVTVYDTPLCVKYGAQ